MKKLFISTILLSGLYMPTTTPTTEVKQYHEIAIIHDTQWKDLWNDLTKEEQIFAYYMYRASIPGHRIIAGQTHRDALELIDMFQQIMENKDTITKSTIENPEAFLKDAETYSVYLFAHHSQYFLREFENHKRTPNNMNLKHLTPDNLVKALTSLGVADAQATVTRLHDSLFDETFEPTVTVDGSIEKSGGNMYSHDFTEADYQALSPADQTGINNYFYIEHEKGTRTPKVKKYKIGGIFSEELKISHHWISKAYAFSKQHPSIFDAHIPASLQHMLDYLRSGDEDDFKKFSIEWLKTNSRVDFNFGFVEVYTDPKQYRGSFEADVTIKTVDMRTLNAMLPAMERQLPFPEKFKRQNLDNLASIPNASVNAKLFGSGDAGPIKLTAAYCLPNYGEIRSEHGSKQVIYQLGKGLGELINPELSLNLFNISQQVAWIKANDPEKKLDRDIWDLHVLLHETLGHGSGRTDLHTFVEGDPMTIDGTTYKIGDTLQVNANNINQFLGRHFSGHEELRADIIALYTSIAHFDQLADMGLLKDWPTKLSKPVLIEQIILHMAQFGIGRLIAQADDATEIAESHAQANTAIMNYLLDHGGLKIVEETYTVNGQEHTVLGVALTDTEKTIQAITDLAIEVQRIKSTADGVALDKFMTTYGTCIRNPEYIKILKRNRQAVQGDLKEVADIFPDLAPVYKDGAIVDILATVPKDFLEQQIMLNKLALSKE